MSAVVTGDQLGDALQLVEAAWAAGDRAALGDAAYTYAALLATSRTHVLVAHLAGVTAGVLASRWLP